VPVGDSLWRFGEMRGSGKGQSGVKSAGGGRIRVSLELDGGQVRIELVVGSD
jgi:hypothetical protein